jgi:hypothetical protein
LDQMQSIAQSDYTHHAVDVANVVDAL